MSGYRRGLAKACDERVGSRSPAVVQRWFATRGVHLTHEFWRRALSGQHDGLVLRQWVEICEALELPLRALIDYEPVGRAPHLPATRRAKPVAPARAAAFETRPPTYGSDA